MPGKKNQIAMIVLVHHSAEDDLTFMAVFASSSSPARKQVHIHVSEYIITSINRWSRSKW